MKHVINICVGVGSEENLENAKDELSAIREEVRKEALKFPAPAIK